MRIISGKYRGRKIDPPAGMAFRPTTDRTREALFNLLMHRFTLPQARVLDLYAGSGAVSVEFLSRGASAVHSIEKAPKHCAWLQRLHKQLGNADWTLHQADVDTWLSRNVPAVPFDFIFMDPPYALADKAARVQQLCAPAWLAPQTGVLVVEHATHEYLADMPHAVEQRDYGQSRITLFQLGSVAT